MLFDAKHSQILAQRRSNCLRGGFHEVLVQWDDRRRPILLLGSDALLQELDRLWGDAFITAKMDALQTGGTRENVAKLLNDLLRQAG